MKRSVKRSIERNGPWIGFANRSALRGPMDHHVAIAVMFYQRSMDWFCWENLHRKPW